MNSYRVKLSIRQNVNAVVYSRERERRERVRIQKLVQGNRRDGIEKWTGRVTER